MRLAPLTNDDAKIAKLLDLELEAARKGVELILSERSSYIALQWVKRHHGEKGVGATVIRMVCDYADDLHMPITLNVFGSRALVRYYRQFGFVGHPDPLSPLEIEMTRTPNWSIGI